MLLFDHLAPRLDLKWPQRPREHPPYFRILARVAAARSPAGKPVMTEGVSSDCISITTPTTCSVRNDGTPFPSQQFHYPEDPGSRGGGHRKSSDPPHSRVRTSVTVGLSEGQASLIFPAGAGSPRCLLENPLGSGQLPSVPFPAKPMGKERSFGDPFSRSPF